METSKIFQMNINQWTKAIHKKAQKQKASTKSLVYQIQKDLFHSLSGDFPLLNQCSQRRRVVVFEWTTVTLFPAWLHPTYDLHTAVRSVVCPLTLLTVVVSNRIRIVLVKLKYEDFNIHVGWRIEN